jgi:putative transposase
VSHCDPETPGSDCARAYCSCLGEIKAGQVILSDFGEIVDDSWRWVTAHYPNVEIDEYVIMPNHIHGIIILNQPVCRGGSRLPAETE